MLELPHPRTTPALPWGDTWTQGTPPPRCCAVHLVNNELVRAVVVAGQFDAQLVFLHVLLPLHSHLHRPIPPAASHHHLCVCHTDGTQDGMIAASPCCVVQSAANGRRSECSPCVGIGDTASAWHCGALSTMPPAGRRRPAIGCSRGSGSIDTIESPCDRLCAVLSAL